MKLIKLSETSNSNRHITPEELISQLVGSPDIKQSTSCLILLLDDADGYYNTNYYASRLSTTEMIALCMDHIRNMQDRMRQV